MKFIVDADLPRLVARVLIELGYDAVDVRDIHPGLFSDEEIAKWASENNRVIITKDTGFGNILDYPPKELPGIVVLRFPSDFNKDKIINYIKRFLKMINIESLSHATTIVEIDRYRIKR